jgi:hypothetical protein
MTVEPVSARKLPPMAETDRAMVRGTVIADEKVQAMAPGPL